MSGSWCFRGHWAQGIYTQAAPQHPKGFTSLSKGPPYSDVIHNDGCHVLRRPVSSGWWSSLLLPDFLFFLFFVFVFLTLSFSFSGFSCAESNSGVNPKVIYFWWHSHFFPWELLLSFTSKRQRVQFNFPSDTWITGVFQRRAGFTVRFRQFVAFLAAQTCAWCLYSHKVID